MINKLKELAEPLAVISKLSLLLFNVSVAFGLTLIMVYCITINYYPCGVTIGDGFLFIVTALSFSFGYGVIAMAIIFSGIAISPALKWLQKIIIFLVVKFQNEQRDVNGFIFPKLRFHHIPILIPGYLSLLIFVSILVIYDFRLGLTLLLLSPVMGFFYAMWNTPSEEKNAKKIILLGVAIILIIVPLPYGLHSHVLKEAMISIGIRIDNATIQLTKSYTQFLEQNGINSPKKDKKHYGYFPNANILLNGIGTNVLVEIDGFKIIVPKQEVKIGSGNKRGQ